MENWVGKNEDTVAGSERIKTKYPGVFYRESKRLGGSGTEKVFYIVFKKDGKICEEKVGRQYADNMTAARASTLRAEIMEGRRPTRSVARELERQRREEEKRKVTIGQLWNDYQLLNSTKRSLITDQYNFRNHLTEFVDRHPEDLLTIDILKLRKRMEDKNYAPATVKHILVLLRMLINWGIKNGICPPVDPSKLRFDIPKLDNERTEMLTPTQIEAYERALDQESDQNLAALFRLALVTGMRKSALMNLRWNDCDMDNRIITLRGEVAKRGKTDYVPMSDVAYAILLNIHRTASEYVFPGKDGGPRKEVRRMARRLKKNAGLPDDFRPLHGLRHAYASFLISSGKVDLYTLQKLLTHSSPKMTQRYAHLADETLRNAAQLTKGMFHGKSAAPSIDECNPNSYIIDND